MGHRAKGSVDVDIYNVGQFYERPEDSQGYREMSWGLHFTAKELRETELQQREIYGKPFVTKINPYTAYKAIDPFYSVGFKGQSNNDLVETVGYIGDPINAYGPGLFVPQHADSSSWIDLRHFEYVGTAGHSVLWDDKNSRPDGGYPIMYFSGGPWTDGEYSPGVSAYNGGLSGLRSRFYLPPNPAFGIALWMPEAPNLTEFDPWTDIAYGMSSGGWRYNIRISGSGEIQPWVRWPDGAWRKMTPVKPGTIRKNNPEATKRTSLHILSVMTTYDGIAMSNDGFTQNVMFWERPAGEGTETQPQGSGLVLEPFPIEVTSNLGKWGFQFFPLVAAVNGYGVDRVLPRLYAPTYRLRFDWYPSLVAFPNNTFMRAKAQPTWADPGLEQVSWGRLYAGCDENPNTLDSLASSLEGTIQPVLEFFPNEFTVSCQVLSNIATVFPNHRYGDTYAGDTLSFPMFTTPLVNSFLMGQYIPRVAVDADPTIDTDKGEENLIAVSIEEEMTEIGRTGKLVADNNTREWNDDLDTFNSRRVNIAARWADADEDSPTYSDNAPVFRGWAEGTSARSSQFRVESSLYDDLAVLSKSTVGGELAIPGEYTKVSEYLGFILTSIGIPEEQLDLEDLVSGGADYFNPGPGVLNVGPWGKTLWTPEVGHTWKRIVDDILFYSADAALWVDHGEEPNSVTHPKIKTGCRWCRTQRTQDDTNFWGYWGKHYGNGPAAEGCIAADALRAWNDDGVDFPLYTTAEYRTTATSDNLKYAIVSVDVPANDWKKNIFNRLIVKGPRPRGEGARDQVIRTAEWAASIDGSTSIDASLGYVKEKTVERDWITTSEIASRIIVQEYGKAIWSAPYAEVVIPLLPEATPGKVFGIYGGSDINVHNRKYRIMKVSHNIMPIAAQCQTKLLGWAIGTMLLDPADHIGA